jgi:hypothetical protein
MTYIIEIHDGHEWVRRSWHKNQASAEIVGEVLSKGGSPTRMIYDGKIIAEWEAEA